MEGSTDNLSIEDEARGEAERPGRTKEDAAEELTPKIDRTPTHKTHATEEAASGCPEAAACPAADASQPPGMGRSACLVPHTVVIVGPLQPSQASSPELASRRTPKASVAEMDCLVCFNRYSASRPPKLLACQHAFCAICLKLILRNEDHTWIITCPLCRKSTVVFGGLVCSLRDKEDILGQLDSPDPEAEVPCPPHPLCVSQANHCGSSSGNPEPRNSRAASKRLVLLLLLVALLVGLVLPFMYTGLLKWALCSVVVLGLVISAVLCCNPRWNCSDFSLPPWRRKESHVASVA